MDLDCHGRHNAPSDCLPCGGSQLQERQAPVSKDSGSLPSTRHVLYGSVCGVRRRDSSGPAPGDHQGGSENQSHRALQQHATTARFTLGTRSAVLLQKTGQSYRCHQALHMPLQPDEGFSITWIALPNFWGPSILCKWMWQSLGGPHFFAYGGEYTWEYGRFLRQI
jgi:hypothetical protein